MRFLGHKTNIAFFIVIALLLVLYVILAIGHFAGVSHLREETRQAKIELEVTKAERDKFKESYEIILEDVQAFGELHQVAYNETTGEQAGLFVPEKIETAAKHLRDEDVWGHYERQMVIYDSCIETTKLVQTEKDEVEIVIVGSSEKDWARLRLFIDAQEIDRHNIGVGEEISKTLVVLPKQTHYLDLMYDNYEDAGDLTISLIRIGDRTIETNVTIIDYGVGLDVFDCRDTDEGSVLKNNGAMRFRIEKV